MKFRIICYFEVRSAFFGNTCVTAVKYISESIMWMFWSNQKVFLYQTLAIRCPVDRNLGRWPKFQQNFEFPKEINQPGNRSFWKLWPSNLQKGFRLNLNLKCDIIFAQFYFRIYVEYFQKLFQHFPLLKTQFFYTPEKANIIYYFGILKFLSLNFKITTSNFSSLSINNLWLV